MDNLKACPFCGNTNIDLHLSFAKYLETTGKQSWHWTIECHECGAFIKKDKAEQAIEAWNRRTEK